MERFTEHFPAAKVSVLITNRSTPQDLFSRFAVATGISLSPPDGGLVENASFGFVEVETVRAFHISAEAAGLPPDATRRIEIFGELESLDDVECFRADEQNA